MRYKNIKLANKTFSYIVHFIFLVLPYSLCLGCNGDDYYKELITIEMVNELQDCEESNLHYTIVTILDGEQPSEVHDNIILPVLVGDNNNEKNNKLLFPVSSRKRNIIKAEGYYSRKGHSDHSSGCLGKHLFKIVRILDVTPHVDSLYL